MNKTDAIGLLTTDVAAWNKYRAQHPDWKPDLRDVDLWGADLRDADLAGANLGGANLSRANLNNANLEHANLWGTKLLSANLHHARLTREQLQPWIGEPDWQDAGGAG